MADVSLSRACPHLGQEDGSDSAQAPARSTAPALHIPAQERLCHRMDQPGHCHCRRDLHRVIVGGILVLVPSCTPRYQRLSVTSPGAGTAQAFIVFQAPALIHLTVSVHILK